MDGNDFLELDLCIIWKFFICIFSIERVVVLNGINENGSVSKLLKRLYCFERKWVIVIIREFL